jgi:hypothetical protein
VIAWAVWEASGDPNVDRARIAASKNDPEAMQGGVVLKNLSQDVALDVDVTTGKRQAADAELTVDNFPGQRFLLIPPGTYYLRQVRHDGGASPEYHWDAPLPLDDSSGRLVARVPGGEPKEWVEESLLPFTNSPELRRVAYLGFTLVGTKWHRADNGKLRALWFSKFRHKDTFRAKFEASTQVALVSSESKPIPDDDVLAAVKRLRAYFDSAASRAKFSGVYSEITVTPSGQTLRLHLVDYPGLAMSIQGAGSARGKPGRIGSTVQFLQLQGTKSLDSFRGVALSRSPEQLATDEDLVEYANEVMRALQTRLDQSDVKNTLAPWRA